jgi:hypothetical protein
LDARGRKFESCIPDKKLSEGMIRALKVRKESGIVSI